MKKLFTICFVFLLTCGVVAQTVVEQQLEALGEALEGELDDDTYLQQLAYFQRHPININTATAEDLQVFKILTPLQIQNLLAYRKLLGPLIDLHELQALPGWDLGTIRRMLPFVSVRGATATALATQLTAGERTALARHTRILQKQKGYEESGASRYAGSADKLLLRYKYQYGNVLQYGLVAEKDAGEVALKTFKNPFDFHSFHLYMRGRGVVKALALGDFTVNMGQGLVQWQSLAFTKSSEVAGVVRQSAVIRPYHGAGEFYFNRGAAATFQQGSWEATVFASRRRLTANALVDTAGLPYMTGFNTSGLHRTKSEIADRKNTTQWGYGGNLTYRWQNLKLGLNAVAHHFSKPLQKRPELYSLYAISGSRWANASLDYTYTYNNIYLFGEAATGQKGFKAFLQGALLSVDPRVDIALLYRHISPGYQALYGNAFTENGLPTNETGFYAGINIRPGPAWRLQGYADHFYFPWVRSRADAPGRGRDYMLQAVYAPSKNVEAYARYRTGSKPVNTTNGAMHEVMPIPKQNLRLHVTYRTGPQVTLRGRLEAAWYDRNGLKEEKGFLLFAEGVYKASQKFSANGRLQYFATGGFNSRIYAYEGDVLYGYSIPFFAGKGFRGYANVSYDVTRRLTVWLRWAETIYTGAATIGSGLEQIRGNRRTEVKTQLRWVFKNASKSF